MSKKLLGSLIILIWFLIYSYAVYSYNDVSYVASDYYGYRDAIKNGIMSAAGTINVKLNNYNSSTYNFNTALNDLMQISPEISYMYGSANIRTSSTTGVYNQTISLSYKHTLQDLSTIVQVNSYEDYYNALKKVLGAFGDKVVLKISSYDSTVYDITKIKERIANDNVDINYGLKSSSHIEYGKGADRILEITLVYQFSKETMQNMKNAVNERANQIIAEVIKPDMQDYEKELVLHDYVVNHSKYDYDNFIQNTIPQESYTAYGILVKGIGVCNGYAEAMKKLLTMVGIESRVVPGYGSGQPHAWNIVKIQGEYYMLDATWDDPVSTSGRESLSFNYFNVTDTQLSKDHQWDRSLYPECSSTRYSYTNINAMLKDGITGTKQTYTPTPTGMTPSPTPSATTTINTGLPGNQNEASTKAAADLASKGWNLAYREGKFEEAIEYYDKAIQLNPGYAPYYDEKGLILMNLGRYEEALKCFEAAIKAAPPCAYYYSNKGDVLLYLKRYPEAAESFDLAIKYDTQNDKINLAGYYSGKGEALMFEGEYEKALEAFNEGLKLNETGLIYYRKASANSALGYKEEAISSLKKAKLLDAYVIKKAKDDENFKNIRDLDEFNKILKYQVVYTDESGNEVDKKLSHSTALYINNPKAIVNGYEMPIDASLGVSPIVINSRTLIPVRFIAENMGADVTWDAKTSMISIKYKDSTAQLKLGAKKMIVSGKELTLDVPAQSINGRTLIPLRRLAEDVLGKKVFYQKDLIILSEEENALDPNLDKWTVDTIITQFTGTEALSWYDTTFTYNGNQISTSKSGAARLFNQMGGMGNASEDNNYGFVGWDKDNKNKIFRNGYPAQSPQIYVYSKVNIATDKTTIDYIDITKVGTFRELKQGDSYNKMVFMYGTPSSTLDLKNGLKKYSYGGNTRLSFFIDTKKNTITSIIIEYL